jgi:hypothetical protein
MNMYTKLAAALEKTKYLRGQYKDDAPADPKRRARNHVRIVSYADKMVIRMHNTDIIKAYPDGSICLDARGWYSNPTTRKAFNDAFRAYGTEPRLYIGSKVVFGLSQTALFVGGKTYLYYDGMTFDAEGVLTSVPHPFRARRIDKAETAELAEGVKSSGFKDMFPLLYATCQPTDTPVYVSRANLVDMLTSEQSANKWSELVATYKYTHMGGWNSQRHEVGNAKTCWSSIMAVAKAGMYRIVDSTTTEILDGIPPKFSPAVLPANPV